MINISFTLERKKNNQLTQLLQHVDSQQQTITLLQHKLDSVFDSQDIETKGLLYLYMYFKI